MEQVSIDIVPYDVTTADAVMNEETGENHVNIHLWCLDKESKPWLIRVRDFPAYFYIELPTIVNGAPFAWDQSSASKIIDYLNKVMGDNAPTNWVFGKFQKLYYYMADRKFPMIFIQFRTLEAVKHCNNLLSKPRQIFPFGTLQLKCYESNIDIIRKFFTARDASFCQWLRVKGTEFTIDDDARISTEGTVEKPIRELSVSYANVAPIPTKESEAWFTHPRILAFDIETYSDNHKAMPNSLNSKHVSNIISCIYYELGNKASRKRYVIVLGDSREVGDDVIVIRVQTELELIKEFAKLVNQLDPEIISGYNIFAYDYPYLDNRLKTKLQDWPIMGRLQKKPTEMTSMVWKSGAYGTNTINILQMEGRLSIDMLPIVKRDYRLDKYSLEFVSQHFLGRGKLDVKAVDMFRAYERQAFIIRYAKNYILEKLGMHSKNWDILETLDKVLETYPNEKETIEKIKARYIHALDEVTKIVAYCVQDSDLVVDLFDKLNVWIGLNALSSVVGVTIIQLFTRGQQVRCLSQVYDKASRKGIVLDKRLKDKVFYAGGFVFEPKPGLYDGVICLDFASLYPSIMRAMNICFTTLVPPDWYDSVPDEHCNIIDVEQEENPTGVKTSSGDGEGEIFDGGDEEDSDSDEDGAKVSSKLYKTYHYKWVKKNVRYGILPEIQDHLVGSRNVIKKELAALEDELEECNDPKRLAEIKLLLVLKDKYSNALKVSANSLYGFLGAQEGGVLSLIEAAMCITATGRKLINQVNDYVIQKYGAEIVYGDSVTGDTPLFIMKQNGEQRVVPIESLLGPIAEKNWKDYRDEKQIINVEPMNISVMTETGFTKIKRYIRHKLHPNKKLFRIKTKYGSVDVTEDHSLILSNGEEISPKNVKIGTELLHNHNQHEYLTQELPFLKNMSEKCIQYTDHLMQGYYPVGKDADKIISIEELKIESDIYVYDLETENHHFAVGPGALVVHNTDSSMIDLHIRDPKACFEAGVKLAEEISGTPEKKLPDGTIIPARPGLFPPPLKMEFEKAMRMLSLRKKKYASFLIGKDGEYVREKNKDGTLGEIKILKRGIIVARRDTCKLVHKTYNDLLHKVLSGSTIKVGFDTIFNMLDNLINDRIPVRGNLSIIRSIGASYKSDSYFMKVFADSMQEKGRGMAASERAEYVVVFTKAEEEGKKDEKLGHKMRLIEMFEESWSGHELAKSEESETGATKKIIDDSLLFDHPDDPLRIPEEPLALYPPEKPDYLYYISHVIAAPLNELFRRGYGKDLEKIKDKGYTPQYSRKRATSLENPIDLIYSIFEDYMKAGYTLEQIRTLMPGIRDFFYKCFEEI